MCGGDDDLVLSSIVARTIVVYLVFLAYFLCFRRFGFQLEDEGTLLFQLDRVTRGQYPYLDFGTGYTPGYFALGSNLLETVGHSIVGLRAALALVHAAAATMIYRLARQLCGDMLALLPAIVWVGFMPVYVGDFASFNVPYPAWFVVPVWLGLAFTLLRWFERGGLATAAFAGVLAAIAFAIKPNAGAYAAAASVWLLCAGARRQGAVDRVVSAAASLLMALGVWFAFGLRLTGSDAVVHVAPLAVLAWLFASPSRLEWIDTPARRHSPVAALSALAAGFAPITLVWAVPTLARLGVDRFARDVLLLGSGAADLFWLGHARLGWYEPLVAAVLLAVGALGVAVSRRRVAPLALLVLFAIGATAVSLLVGQSALMPEGAAAALNAEIEKAAFVVVPLVHWVGLALLFRGGSMRRPRLLVAVVVSVAMYWQLFPRSDFTHLVFSAPVSFVLATVLLAKVLEHWAKGRWPPQVQAGALLPVAVWSVAAVVVLLRVLGPLASALSCSAGESRGPLDHRLAVCVEAAASDDITALRDAAAYVGEQNDRDDRLLAFPALGGVLYGAGVTSATPHDFWFPGRPDHVEELDVVLELTADPPPYIVAQNDGWWTMFVRAPVYYEALRGFVRDRYRLDRRFGRFDVLELTAPVGGEALDPAHGSGVELPAGDSDASPEPPIEKVPAYRRQAVRRWLARIDSTERASLSSDPAEAVLQLRAIRDAGDFRASAWLLQGYSRPESQVRREAVSAMDLVLKRFAARAAGWAGDFALDDFAPGPGSDEGAGAAALAAAPEPAVARYAEALAWVSDAEHGPLDGETPAERLLGTSWARDALDSQ